MNSSYQAHKVLGSFAPITMAPSPHGAQKTSSPPSVGNTGARWIQKRSPARLWQVTSWGGPSEGDDNSLEGPVDRRTLLLLVSYVQQCPDSPYRGGPGRACCSNGTGGPESVVLWPQQSNSAPKFLTDEFLPSIMLYDDGRLYVWTKNGTVDSN